MRPAIDSDDEDEDGEEGREGVSVGLSGDHGKDVSLALEEHDRDPMALSSEESDDEEEMAELRRKVLQSKPFARSDETSSKSTISTIAPPVARLVDSDDEPGSDNGEDDDFDNIINATPVTDRAGIQAQQRLKGREPVSAVFSRTVVNAPRKR